MQSAPLCRLGRGRGRRRSAMDGFGRMAVGAMRAGIRADRKLDLDRFSGFIRDRGAQQVEVALGNPFAEKFIWRLERGGLIFQTDKFQRLDPGLEANLSDYITNVVCGLLPHAVHLRASSRASSANCANRSTGLSPAVD